MRTLVLSGFACLVLLAADGCRKTDGPQTYPVSGTVTLDGKPLDTGEILFRSEGGTAATYAGKISAGKYSLSATAGKKRVEITSTQIVPGKQGERGGTPGDPISETNTAHIYEEVIPEDYNQKSTLTADVSPTGSNPINFTLKRSGK